MDLLACLHNKHFADGTISLAHFSFSFLASTSESSTQHPTGQQIIVGLLWAAAGGVGSSTVISGLQLQAKHKFGRTVK